MTRPLQVLVAEDDSNDLLFTNEALAAASRPVQVAAVRGGQACLAALADPQARLDLVLLDLNMPDLDGWAVLEALPPGNRPLVVVLSSAADRDSAERCYALGADLYLVKPAAFGVFEAMLDGLVRWAAAVQRLPSMPPTR